MDSQRKSSVWVSLELMDLELMDLCPSLSVPDVTGGTGGNGQMRAESGENDSEFGWMS